MIFRDPGVLALDIGARRLRALHGEISEGILRVRDFAVEEQLVPGWEGATAQVEALVARKKLGSAAASLVLSGPGVVHRLLDFPAMPLAELDLVVSRDMAAAGTGEDAVFDWELVQEIEAGGIKQLRVLVAIAPKSQVDAVKTLVERCRLRVALVSTAPICLLRSLDFLEGGREGPQGLLYLDEERGHLLGIKNRVWSFYREFSGRDGGESGLLDEAVREVNRALLYHGRAYDEEEKLTFLLGGETAPEELANRVRKETGVEARLARPGPALDLAPLAEKARLFRDLFPSFLIALGLVAAAYAKSGINLAPKAARKKVRRAAIDFTPPRPVLVLVALSVLLGIHLFFDWTERSYRRLLQEREALYAQWLPAIRASEESRALRQVETLLRETLGSARPVEVRWVALFKLFSRLAPPDLTLRSMIFEREKDRWRITLRGEVLSLDAYAAQAAFNRFYQGLKRSPGLSDVDLLPLTVVRLKAEPEAPAEKAAARAGAGKAPEERAPQRESQIQSAGLTAQTKIEFELRAYVRAA